MFSSEVGLDLTAKRGKAWLKMQAEKYINEAEVYPGQSHISSIAVFVWGGSGEKGGGCKDSEIEVILEAEGQIESGAEKGRLCFLLLYMRM